MRPTPLGAFFITLVICLGTVVAAPVPARWPTTPDPAFLAHGPILVDGDASFTSANGVTGGNGTRSNPFIIEGWDINASNADGIKLQNTRAYVVIRNVSIQSGPGFLKGVFLENVSNVGLIDLTIREAYAGIYAYSAWNLSIARNRLYKNHAYAIHAENVANLTVELNEIAGNPDFGILLANSFPAEIRWNNVLENSEGIYVFSRSGVSIRGNNIIRNGNQAYDGGTNVWDGGYPEGGNYWSDYSGQDLCGGSTQDICTGPDGIGDSPIYSDRYPLMAPHAPVPELPVATFSYAPLNPLTGDPVSFDATASSDPAGAIVSYQWDFGDGVVGSGVIVNHTFSVATLYQVELTIRDDRGVSAKTHLGIEVGQRGAPVASFVVTPQSVEAGHPVALDASSSSDPDGRVVSFGWSFGDGSTGTGVRVVHLYQAAGNYTVRLTVTDDSGYRSTASAVVSVAPPALVPIALVRYSNPAGFAVPIPENWTREENQPSPGGVLELVLLGPVYNTRTNIIVDMQAHPGAREDSAYLFSLVNATLEQLRQERPDAEVTQGPTLRTVAGHAAVVFRIQYGTSSLVQRVAILVSAIHQRDWVVVLTVDAYYYGVAGTAFDAMLDGFEITAPVPTPVWIFVVVVGAIGSVTAAIVLGIIFSRQSRRRTRLRQPMDPGTIEPPRRS